METMRFMVNNSSLWDGARPVRNFNGRPGAAIGFRVAQS